MNKKEIIESSLLFGGLPAQQIDDINGIAIEKTFQKGVKIFFLKEIKVSVFIW